MNSNIQGDTLKNQNYEFAILVDSCCDVPEEYLEKYPIYVLPLRINYKGKSYRDRIDISPEEIYRKLSIEIPTTSLPEYSDVEEVFDNIIKDGYNKIISISISSNLSGTFNLIRLVSEEFKEKGIDIYLFDTKNIAIGSGMYAISVADNLEEGKSYKETIQLLKSEYGNSKVFFCVETLEYLRKGGRIGRVASMLGSALGVKPIITCDEDGTYCIAGKERGSKRCIKKVIALVNEFASRGKKAQISIMCSGERIELPEIKNKLEQLLPNSIVKIQGQISPVLGVHVGPGLIGIAVLINV
ncbi:MULTISPECIES: DegV family protein [Clostridium]|uniref:DegV family protein n=1 Tax=Clostridium TaxID=1485 RepID=UPI0008265519|nr:MULTISPECIES: DegV family protein [Clostridium]PJI07190.1 DegV family protein [Clostridium sp. CT7]